MPMYAVSPLRYPGAKWRLEAFVSAILADNNLTGGRYIELYAGGASLALSLLYGGHVSDIHINDLDRSIYAFWKSATEHSEDLIDLIRKTPVTMNSWRTQQEVQKNKTHASLLALGFSTFFLNRTNRSGILTGGVIGGKNQDGQWKLDARFTKSNLISRIERVAAHRSQIHVTKMDAMYFLKRRGSTLPKKCFVYLDPPYYVKGSELYLNAYRPEDHEKLASTILSSLRRPWMVSYDDVPEIRALYGKVQSAPYILRYSASKSRKGREVVFLSPKIETRSKLLRNT